MAEIEIQAFGKFNQIVTLKDSRWVAGFNMVVNGVYFRGCGLMYSNDGAFFASLPSFKNRDHKVGFVDKSIFPIVCEKAVALYRAFGGNIDSEEAPSATDGDDPKDIASLPMLQGAA